MRIKKNDGRTGQKERVIIKNENLNATFGQHHQEEEEECRLVVEATIDT